MVRVARFHANLEQGIALSSDYSGLWGDREVWCLILDACRMKFQWSDQALRETLKFHSAGDTNPLCQQ
eukprot:15458841-Alexandrium_andersonii.AAC.1